MGRLFCNGKHGFCDRVRGTAEECEYVSCSKCEFADGSGSKYIDKITNYDRIRTMDIDEMATFFATDSHPNFPHSPCYICEYNDGLCCVSDVECTKEYKAEKYKQWLESEAE